MTQSSRPLSPHLGIYRFTITMTMSIVHRITGMGLYFGTALIAAWLVAAALGEGPLNFMQAVAGSWIGLIVLIAFTWGLFHHMLSGLRHFLWDLGLAYSERARFGITWAALIGGFVLTALLWAVILAT